VLCRQVEIVNVGRTELDAERSIRSQADDPLGSQYVRQIDLDHFADRQGFDPDHLEDQQNIVIGLRRIVALGVSPLNGRFQEEPWSRIPMTL
jgi:hypothetical protein